ncbi:hypothetical protein J6590_051258 [Homalodisca vitripennis]|nr:hypothetical protein J6590_051258 [Homalodisca vitripennis]
MINILKYNKELANEVDCGSEQTRQRQTWGLCKSSATSGEMWEQNERHNYPCLGYERQGSGHRPGNSGKLRNQRLKK